MIFAHVQPRALGRQAGERIRRCAAPITAQSIEPGDERAWWQTAGVDPLEAVRKLLKPTIRAVDS